MSRQMYFKRAKIFLAQDPSGGEQRYLAPVGGPVAVPNWVCKTLGYSLGIKDGSIVDITPPNKPAPVVEEEEEPATPAVSEADPAETDDSPGEEAEDTAEETPAVPTPTVNKFNRAGNGFVRASGNRTR